MNKNKIFIGIISTSCLVIIAIGLFFSTGSYNVMAEGITTIINEDSIKEYNLIEKEITIKDIDRKSLVKIKLLTPLDNKVGLGYQRVAEYEVSSIESLKILVSKMELYDISDSMKSIERTIDYKIKGVEEFKVIDYKTICEVIKDSKNDTENCTQEIVGSHLEERITWLSLDKVDFIKDENIIVGLYTDVQKGDKIEWIPTFQIDDNVKIRVEEWATWTADLNTNLEVYYKLDETSGTMIDSVGNYDGTNYGGVPNTTGKIGTAYDYVSSDYSKIADSSIQPDDATISLWHKPDATFQWLDMLIGKKATSANRFYVTVAETTNDYYIKLTKGNDNFAFITTGTGFVDNVWNHLVITIDGTTVKVWANGVSISNTSTSNTLNGILGDWNLAREPTTSYYYEGVIDEVGIWSRALTSTEIIDLYNSGDGLAYISPTVYCNFSGYAFDEDDTALVGANVTVWNQFNVSEYYSNTTIADGKWSVQVPNSTNTYMAGAYYNNTLIGQLKQGISGTC